MNTGPENDLFARKEFDEDIWTEAVAKLGKYGLGTRRTFEQYANYSGVNPITKKLTKQCIVEYVPWDESEKNTVYMEYEKSGGALLRGGRAGGEH